MVLNRGRLYLALLVVGVVEVDSLFAHPNCIFY